MSSISKIPPGSFDLRLAPVQLPQASAGLRPGPASLPTLPMRKPGGVLNKPMGSLPSAFTPALKPTAVITAARAALTPPTPMALKPGGLFSKPAPLSLKPAAAVGAGGGVSAKSLSGVGQARPLDNGRKYFLPPGAAPAQTKGLEQAVNWIEDTKAAVGNTLNNVRQNVSDGLNTAGQFVRNAGSAAQGAADTVVNTVVDAVQNVVPGTFGDSQIDRAQTEVFNAPAPAPAPARTQVGASGAGGATPAQRAEQQAQQRAAENRTNSANVRGSQQSVLNSNAVIAQGSNATPAQVEASYIDINNRVAALRGNSKAQALDPTALTQLERNLTALRNQRNQNTAEAELLTLGQEAIRNPNDSRVAGVYNDKLAEMNAKLKDGSYRPGGRVNLATAAKVNAALVPTRDAGNTALLNAAVQRNDQPEIRRLHALISQRTSATGGYSRVDPNVMEAARQRIITHERGRNPLSQFTRNLSAFSNNTLGVQAHGSQQRLKNGEVVRFPGSAPAQIENTIVQTGAQLLGLAGDHLWGNMNLVAGHGNIPPTYIVPAASLATANRLLGPDPHTRNPFTYDPTRASRVAVLMKPQEPTIGSMASITNPGTVRDGQVGLLDGIGPTALSTLTVPLLEGPAALIGAADGVEAVQRRIETPLTNWMQKTFHAALPTPVNTTSSAYQMNHLVGELGANLGTLVLNAPGAAEVLQHAGAGMARRPAALAARQAPNTATATPAVTSSSTASGIDGIGSIEVPSSSLRSGVAVPDAPSRPMDARSTNTRETPPTSQPPRAQSPASPTRYRLPSKDMDTVLKEFWNPTPPLAEVPRNAFAAISGGEPPQPNRPQRVSIDELLTREPRLTQPDAAPLIDTLRTMAGEQGWQLAISPDAIVSELDLDARRVVIGSQLTLSNINATARSNIEVLHAQLQAALRSSATPAERLAPVRSFLEQAERDWVNPVVSPGVDSLALARNRLEALAQARAQFDDVQPLLANNSASTLEHRIDAVAESAVPTVQRAIDEVARRPASTPAAYAVEAMNLVDLVEQAAASGLDVQSLSLDELRTGLSDRKLALVHASGSQYNEIVNTPFNAESRIANMGRLAQRQLRGVANEEHFDYASAHQLYGRVFVVELDKTVAHDIDALAEQAKTLEFGPNPYRNMEVSDTLRAALNARAGGDWFGRNLTWSDALGQAIHPHDIATWLALQREMSVQPLIDPVQTNSPNAMAEGELSALAAALFDPRGRTWYSTAAADQPAPVYVPTGQGRVFRTIPESAVIRPGGAAPGARQVPPAAEPGMRDLNDDEAGSIFGGSRGPSNGPPLPGPPEGVGSPPTVRPKRPLGDRVSAPVNAASAAARAAWGKLWSAADTPLRNDAAKTAVTQVANFDPFRRIDKAASNAFSAPRNALDDLLAGARQKRYPAKEQFQDNEYTQTIQQREKLAERWSAYDQKLTQAHADLARLQTAVSELETRIAQAADRPGLRRELQADLRQLLERAPAIHNKAKAVAKELGAASSQYAQQADAALGGLRSTRDFRAQQLQDALQRANGVPTAEVRAAQKALDAAESSLSKVQFSNSDRFRDSLGGEQFDDTRTGSAGEIRSVPSLPGQGHRFRQLQDASDAVRSQPYPRFLQQRSAAGLDASPTAYLQGMLQSLAPLREVVAGQVRHTNTAVDNLKAGQLRNATSGRAAIDAQLANSDLGRELGQIGGLRSRSKVLVKSLKAPANSAPLLKAQRAASGDAEALAHAVLGATWKERISPETQRVMNSLRNDANPTARVGELVRSLQADAATHHTLPLLEAPGMNRLRAAVKQSAAKLDLEQRASAPLKVEKILERIERNVQRSDSILQQATIKARRLAAEIDTKMAAAAIDTQQLRADIEGYTARGERVPPPAMTALADANSAVELLQMQKQSNAAALERMRQMHTTHASNLTAARPVLAQAQALQGATPGKLMRVMAGLAGNLHKAAAVHTLAGVPLGWSSVQLGKPAALIAAKHLNIPPPQNALGTAGVVLNTPYNHLYFAAQGPGTRGPFAALLPQMLGAPAGKSTPTAFIGSKGQIQAVATSDRVQLAEIAVGSSFHPFGENALSLQNIFEARLVPFGGALRSNPRADFSKGGARFGIEFMGNTPASPAGLPRRLPGVQLQQSTKLGVGKLTLGADPAGYAPGRQVTRDIPYAFRANPFRPFEAFASGFQSTKGQQPFGAGSTASELGKNFQYDTTKQNNRVEQFFTDVSQPVDTAFKWLGGAGELPGKLADAVRNWVLNRVESGQPSPAAHKPGVAKPAPDRGAVVGVAVTRRAPPDASNIVKTNRGDTIVGVEPFVLVRTKAGEQAWVRPIQIEYANGQQREALQIVQAHGKVTEFYGDAASPATLQKQFQAGYKVAHPVR